MVLLIIHSFGTIHIGKNINYKEMSMTDNILGDIIIINKDKEYIFI